MNDIVCLQKYKTIVSTSTVISGSAKGVTYLLLKIGFCFLPNVCSLMGRMKLVMYSRLVIEVAWFHMGWRKLSVEWVAMPFSRRSSRQGLKPHLLGLLLCQEGSLVLEPPGSPRNSLHYFCFPGEVSGMECEVCPAEVTSAEMPFPAFPSSEWGCGMPKDVLSPSQLLSRLPPRAHCRRVLQGLPT